MEIAQLKAQLVKNKQELERLQRRAADKPIVGQYFGALQLDDRAGVQPAILSFADAIHMELCPALYGSDLCLQTFTGPASIVAAIGLT